MVVVWDFQARLHLGSRPASSLTHSDSETEEVLWHRNVSQAAGGSGPTGGSAKGPTDAKAAAPPKPKGTGAVIHRRSRVRVWTPEVWVKSGWERGADVCGCCVCS